MRVTFDGTGGHRITRIGSITGSAPFKVLDGSFELEDQDITVPFQYYSTRPATHTIASRITEKRTACDRSRAGRPAEMRRPRLRRM